MSSDQIDPFLSLHDHLDDHRDSGHGPGHDHDHGRGPGAGAGTTEAGASSGSPTDRLTDFATHIHDHSHADHDHDHDHEHDHGHGHVLSFTGEGGVLESSSTAGHFDADVRDALRQTEEHGVSVIEDEGDFEPHLEDRDHDHDHRHEREGGTASRPNQSASAGQGQGQSRRSGPARGGRKRKAGGVDAHGEPIDPAILKKAYHKEVERKRRNNINDGIDQLVAQMGIPDLDKMGKGAQLRRAVEYVADVSDRMIVYEKEVDDLRKEKQDLEANLALTSQRYTEEHDRCTRYETMWREAEDREAKSQFDIAQLLDEVAHLRRKAGEA